MQIILLLSTFSPRNGNGDLRAKSSISETKQPNEDLAATEFKRFSKLPIELHLMVWHFTAQVKRTIKIGENERDPTRKVPGAKHNAATVPSIIHTCQESRTVGLECYQLRFGTCD